MKPKRLALALLGCAILGAAAFLPIPSSGQAPAAVAVAEDPQIELLVGEVAAQQKVIAANQAKIDAQVAAIAEEVRIARIFAGRAGGKAK